MFSLIAILSVVFMANTSASSAYILPESRNLPKAIPNEVNAYPNMNNLGSVQDRTHISKSSVSSPMFGGVARIAGGVPLEEQYTCSMAYITLNSLGRMFTASGVLISRTKVLTAAHNFDDFTPTANVTVYLGDRQGGSSVPVGIDNIWRLSGYADGNPRGGNDLAIMNLTDAQPSNCTIDWQNAAVVDPTDGDSVTALGYGRSSSSRTDALGEGTLRQGSLRIAENGHTVRNLAVCADQSHNTQVICAVSPGYPNSTESGTCLSDSGGPLIKNDGTTKWVVGINSYSDTNCDAPGNVDMFARVYTHRVVLEGIVGNSNTTGWTALP